jgi:hypothetical protein
MTRNGSATLVDEDYLQIPVVLFLSVAPEWEYDERNLILGGLLLYLKSFRGWIRDIRDVKLGIEQRPYPKGCDIGCVFDILDTLPLKKRIVLNEQVNKIGARYKLSRNWNIPLKMVILTDAFPVPPNEGDPIRIHRPFSEQQKSHSTRADLVEVTISPGRNGPMEKYKLPRRALDILYYPALYFTRDTSGRGTKGLPAFLRENRREIVALQRGLPKPAPRVERNALFWGHLVWVMKHIDGITAYKKMEENLAKVYENESQKESDALPDQNQLRNYYQRFLTSLDKLEQH